MENSNRGKVVVVTGATAGVRRAVVTEFARQGAHIGLIARGRERFGGNQTLISLIASAREAGCIASASILSSTSHCIAAL